MGTGHRVAQCYREASRKKTTALHIRSFPARVALSPPCASRWHQIVSSLAPPPSKPKSTCYFWPFAKGFSNSSRRCRRFMADPGVFILFSLHTAAHRPNLFLVHYTLRTRPVVGRRFVRMGCLSCPLRRDRSASRAVSCRDVTGLRNATFPIRFVIGR